MTYAPRPFDTSSVHLTGDLNELIELLAKNTHDNWAAKRMQQGWRYGPVTNEKTKEHSLLVKYEDLSDSDKELDRIAARELLKSLIYLGYQIEKE